MPFVAIRRRDDVPVSLEIVFLVLLAGLVHAIWNAMVKGISSQFTSFALMNSGTAFVSWMRSRSSELPRGAAWPFVLASTACHLGYELFLMGSYRRANSLAPIDRAGWAPLLVSIGGRSQMKLYTAPEREV